MAKEKFAFEVEDLVVEVGGKEFTFRPLTVRELEGLVKTHEGEGQEEALTAAIIVTGEVSGRLEGYTADDFGEWPAQYYRALQSAVSKLNGLGETDSGNG